MNLAKRKIQVKISKSRKSPHMKWGAFDGEVIWIAYQERPMLSFNITGFNCLPAFLNFESWPDSAHVNPYDGRKESVVQEHANIEKQAEQD